MPTISVIIRVHNRTKYLSFAIQSILYQKFKDFEIIIIDDNSQTKIEHILKRFNDKRIKYYKTSTNLGITNTLIMGFELAQGKYVTNLDDDDVYLPHNLLTNYETFTKTDNNIAFVYGRAGIINSQGDRIFVQKKHNVNSTSLKFGNLPIIYSCTYMIKKTIFQKIQHDITKIPCSDYIDDKRIVIASIKNGYKIFSHNNIIALHRLSNTNYTANVFKTGQYLNDLTILVVYTTKPYFPYKRIPKYFLDIFRRIVGLFTFRIYRTNINTLLIWLLKYPQIFIHFFKNTTNKQE